MANRKQPTPIPIQTVRQASNPGATSRESMEGISGNPDLERDAPSTAAAFREIEGNPPDRRDDGGRGTKPPEKGSPSLDRGLPASAPIVTSSPIAIPSDGNILQAIASRFNEAREISKNSAWRQLQTDLMNASPHICPHLIPYKDLLSAVADIEKEIKGSNVQVGKSNEELLSEFLNGEGVITLNEEDAPDRDDSEKVLDSEGKIDERDESTVSPERTT